MLVAGEASRKKGFQCAVKAAAKRLETKNHPPQWSMFNERGDQIITIPAPSEIEVVFAKDGEFAAAKGAAVWARMKMEEGHCCDTLTCCPNVLLTDEPDNTLLTDETGEARNSNEAGERFVDEPQETCDWLEYQY